MVAARRCPRATASPCLAVASTCFVLLGCWTDEVRLGELPCADASAACVCSPSSPDADHDGVCDARDRCPGDDGADGDADGVCDGLDRCPGPDTADGDGDGVCDGLDRCPGAEDGVDVDADGVPDCLDRCSFDGPSPPPLFPLPVEVDGLVIRSFEFANGLRITHARPGEVVTVRLAFTASDCGCPGCVWVVQLGLVGDPGPQTCVWTGTPGCGGISTEVTASVHMPSESGQYGIRVLRQQDFTCTPTWEPGHRIEEIGVVCVD